MRVEPPSEHARWFRPAWWIWLLPMFGVLLAVWAPPGISSPGPEGRAEPFADRMYSVFLAAILLGAFGSFATSYVVTRDGIERRRLFFFRRLFPWEDIARVGGKRVYAKGRYGMDIHSESAVTTIVLDHDGEVLFRVGPWIPGRRRLARLLREHAKS